MARMIPGFVDSRTPPGEREVFGKLQAAPDNWTILHSLDVAPWNKQLRTEIDFFIIIPDVGAICVEVKSHEHIRFDGERWHPASIKRSPFKQAADGRYAVKRGLARLLTIPLHIPIAHCCIFPCAHFYNPTNLSVPPRELIDGTAFKSMTPDQLATDLKQRLIESISADKTLKPLRQSLQPQEVAQIVDCCVPIQKRGSTSEEELQRRSDAAVQALREQQRPVLKLVEANDRVLITGPAGTGKTRIALEAAQQLALRGERVALLCFNRLVGLWLESQAAKSGHYPTLVAGSANRVLMQMAEITVPDDVDQTFWDNELPNRILSRFTEPDFRSLACFDYLVLDEAQDIASRPWLWACIDSALDGGFKDGRFAIFGDFQNQVLSDFEQAQLTLANLDTISRPARWSLSENCRNYRIVGDTAVSLSGLNHRVYSGYMKTGGIHEYYDIQFYKDPSERVAVLAAWIKGFLTAGFSQKEITMLSFKSEDTDLLKSLASMGYRFHHVSAANIGMSWASIHSYKGLENRVILIPDASVGNADFDRYLFYVGMTRATDCVRVLCDEDSKPCIVRWLQEARSQ